MSHQKKQSFIFPLLLILEKSAKVFLFYGLCGLKKFSGRICKLLYIIAFKDYSRNRIFMSKQRFLITSQLLHCTSKNLTIDVFSFISHRVIFFADLTFVRCTNF